MVKELIHIRGAGTPVDPKIEVYMPRQLFDQASDEIRQGNYKCAAQVAWEHGFTHIRIRHWNHTTAYAIDVQGRRIAWDDRQDWILLDADPHLTVIFWNQYIPGESYNGHVYVIEENGVPVQLMSLSQRKHSRWNDDGAPQLWCKKKRCVEPTEWNTLAECSSSSSSSSSVGSVPSSSCSDSDDDSIVHLPEWQLALAAHFRDIQQVNPTEPFIDITNPAVRARLEQFLAEQRALTGSEFPEFDSPAIEFMSFLNDQERYSSHW